MVDHLRSQIKASYQMDKSMDESQVKQSNSDFPQELIIKSYQSQKKKLDFSSPQKTQVINIKDK